MRYIVNAKNYVTAVSFGALLNYADCDCTEYTGKIPSGWNSLEEWFEDEGGKLWRWKIKSGNLTLDSTAVAPEEGQWGIPELQNKTVTGMILEDTVITADKDYDGLGTVIIKAQPGWLSAHGSENKNYVTPTGNQLILDTGTDRMPKAIMIQCSKNIGATDHMQYPICVANMWIELTDGNVTANDVITKFPTGELVRGSISVSVSGTGGLLFISINQHCFYITPLGDRQLYDCYLMY